MVGLGRDSLVRFGAPDQLALSASTSAPHRPRPGGGPEAARSPAADRCDRPRSRQRPARPATGRVAVDGHRAAEAVDDPVFGHAERQVLAPLLLVVAEPVALAPRDELDGDRGDVHRRVGPTPQPRPDHPVRPAPAVARLDITLRRASNRGWNPGDADRGKSRSQYPSSSLGSASASDGIGFTTSTPWTSS